MKQYSVKSLAKAHKDLHKSEVQGHYRYDHKAGKVAYVGTHQDSRTRATLVSLNDFKAPTRQPETKTERVERIKEKMVATLATFDTGVALYILHELLRMYK